MDSSQSEKYSVKRLGFLDASPLSYGLLDRLPANRNWYRFHIVRDLGQHAWTPSADDCNIVRLRS
jgi:hypothetical protein